MTEAHAGGRSWWGMRGRAPITITNAMVFMLVFSCNLRLFGAIWAL